MDAKKIIDKFKQEQTKWIEKSKDYSSMDKFQELGNKAYEKMGTNKDKFKDGIEGLTRFIKMTIDYFKDDFVIPKKELMMIIGGIIYFVSPLDIVPDFIPIVGFLDDVTVIAFITKQLSGLIGTYEKKDDVKKDIINIKDYIDVEVNEIEEEK